MATKLTNVNTFENMPMHVQHLHLQRIMRLAGIAGGKARVTHVVQVELIHNTPEAGLLDVPNSVNWVLTERHLTDDDRVGRMTRVINSDAFSSHAELHAQLRGWMMSQSYMTDFGPTHCDLDCVEAERDNIWHTQQYVPRWQSRLIPWYEGRIENPWDTASQVNPMDLLDGQN